MHAHFPSWSRLAAAALLVAAAAACTDRPTEPARPRAAMLPDMEGSPALVVGSNVRGVARLLVVVRDQRLGTTARFDFRNERPADAEAWGAVKLARGTYGLTVRGYDREGRGLVAGELTLSVEGDVVAQVRAPAELLIQDDRFNRAQPAEVYAGSVRFDAEPRWVEASPEKLETPLAVRLFMHGADGVPLPVDLDRLDVKVTPEELGGARAHRDDDGIDENLIKLDVNGPGKWPPFDTKDDLPTLEVVTCDGDALACATVVTVILFPPIFVLDLYRKVVASESHTCALKDGGMAMCWGTDNFGVLAGGPAANELAARRWSDIDVHRDHGCAIEKSTGTAFCWGLDREGQLGHGAFAGGWDPEPFPVAAPVKFTAITTGDSHTCALATDGSIWCWGSNELGQLGDGNGGWLKRSMSPVRVKSMSQYVQVDAGELHNCALTTTGTVECWGFTFDKQTGDAPNAGGCPDRYGFGQPCRETPAPVSGGSYRSVSAGGSTSCAARTDKRVFCWGTPLAPGYPGAQSAPTGTPTVVPGSDVSFVFVGATHACGYDPFTLAAPYGPSKCWGANDEGQLGGGSTGQPSVMGTNLTSAGFAAGDRYTCGIFADRDKLLCWGRSGDHLGFPNSAQVLQPTRVTVF